MPILYRACAYLCVCLTAEVIFNGLGNLKRTKNWALPAETTLWMAPIYFFGPLGLELVEDAASRWPILLRGAAYAVLILAAEFLAASVLRLALKKDPWRYERGWHVQGKIRLDYFPFWFLFGLALERLHYFFLAVKI